MVGEIVHGHRAERVQSDVESHPLDVQAGEQFRREVEAGRRCGGRALVLRVDRLVALGIGERLGDVRRQGRLSGGLALEP